MDNRINACEIARDEALLIARIAFNDAIREGLNEDQATAVFNEAFDDALDQ
jgi:hypothetical protein